MSRRAGLGVLEPDMGAAARENERRERRRREYRPPMWDTDAHGKPAGRFARVPEAMGGDTETRRVLVSSNANARSVSDSHLTDAWRKMRVACAMKRAHHQQEGAAVLDAFVAVERARETSGEAKKPGTMGKCSVTPAEFKKVWWALGVRDMTDAEVKAVFGKVGFDNHGQMPYEVFVKWLILKQSRVLGKEEVKKGPFADADDAQFFGKITTPRSVGATQTPSDWLEKGGAIAVRSMQAPRISLELNHAHGFPGAKVLGNSVHATKRKTLVYFAGALGVVYDPKTHKQRFFRGHARDIRAIAAHPDGVTFATGDGGANPSACVWSSEVQPGCASTSQCVELARVTDRLGYARSFVALAFSPNGEHLLTVGSDDKHTVFLWDWRKHTGGTNNVKNTNNNGPLVSFPSAQAAVPAVWGALFNPFRVFVEQKRKNAPKKSSQKPFASGLAAFGDAGRAISQKEKPERSFEFVTYGAKHVKLWRKDGDGRWVGRPLCFGKQKTFSIHAACFLPGGTLLVGADDGSLAVFCSEKRALKRIVRSAHGHRNQGNAPSVQNPQKENTKGVRCLVFLETENAVVSAGADGRVLAWRLRDTKDDIHDDPFEEISLTHPLGDGHAPPRIRSLAVMPEDRTEATTRKGTGNENDGVSRRSETRPVSDACLPVQTVQTETTKNAAPSRAADRPWGVESDPAVSHPGRFPMKPLGVAPWAVADCDALGDTGNTSVVPNSSDAKTSSDSSSLFSRVACFAGTAGCDLWEVTSSLARVRIAGATGTVESVSWHPKFSVCATVGSDGWVRLCDAETRAQIAAKDVGDGARGLCVAFSPDGQLLATGFENGRLVVLNARTLVLVAETTPVARERSTRPFPGWSEACIKNQNRISAVSFSPDASYLAATGGDRTVRVYANVHGAFALVAKGKGHSATVRALDWSEDGTLLRSQCVGNELLHWLFREDGGRDDGRKETRCSKKTPWVGETRDVKWCTHCSTAGFPVMGVSSNVHSIDVSSDRKHLVAGDASGGVSVLNHPCVCENAGEKKHQAHGGRVKDVQFSGDNAWVASVGGGDGTLLVWKVVGA